jgi:hypothetical protein
MKFERRLDSFEDGVEVCKVRYSTEKLTAAEVSTHSHKSLNTSHRNP